MQSCLIAKLLIFCWYVVTLGLCDLQLRRSEQDMTIDYATVGMPQSMICLWNDLPGRCKGIGTQALAVTKSSYKL